MILYLHGSGYVLASPRTHRGLVSRLSRATALPAFVSDYRLAPEHRFPAAADDVAAAYRWLVEQGYPAHRIVLAGDSAGGHLALDLVFELARRGEPVPAAMLLFSPLFDLSFSLAARREKAQRDPMISAAAAARLVGLYTRGVDPASPRLALRADGTTALPPTLIQAGGLEMLAADAVALTDVLRAAGGDCDLQIWRGQMHVFQALALLVPEARVALSEAAGFVTKTLQRSAGDDEQRKP